MSKHGIQFPHVGLVRFLPRYGTEWQSHVMGGVKESSDAVA